MSDCSKQDGVAPFDDRSYGNSTTLHSHPIICNCQDTTSIIAHPPDIHAISYNQPIYSSYGEHKEHNEVMYARSSLLT